MFYGIFFTPTSKDLSLTAKITQNAVALMLVA